MAFADRAGMYPTRARRFPDFDYTGAHRYSLTFCTYQRRPILMEAPLVDVLSTQILRAARDRAFDICVYSFMPDHLHLLVRGCDAEVHLPRFVKHAKQLTGYHGRRHAKRKIWQPGFYERLLDDDEDARVAIAYILMNPVRAGLVTQPGDYPYSGSGLCELPDLIEQVHRYV